jgi:hypothetical protein
MSRNLPKSRAGNYAGSAGPSQAKFPITPFCAKCGIASEKRTCGTNPMSASAWRYVVNSDGTELLSFDQSAKRDICFAVPPFSRRKDGTPQFFSTD